MVFLGPLLGFELVPLGPLLNPELPPRRFTTTWAGTGSVRRRADLRRWPISCRRATVNSQPRNPASSLLSGH